MPNPTVSIITPTYNHEKFIKECIESVLNQTYDNWEQIIIDDGSTDNTRDIIAEFDDNRIKLIKQDNLGIYNLDKTYNGALKSSKGKLIAILEGDDYWPSDKLEKQTIIFNNPNVVLSYGKAAVTDSNGNILKFTPKDIFSKRTTNTIETLHNLLFSNFIPACTVICRKDSLLSIGGFIKPKYSPTVDYSTWLNLSLKGHFFGCADLLGYWRTHEKQTSNQKVLEMVKAQKYVIDFFEILPLEIKTSTSLSAKELNHNYHQQLSSVYAYLGLKCLNNGDWDGSKKSFKAAYNNGSLNLKLKSLLGLVCANLKVKLIL
jgi:glycosyltransferase involved in cell wall biosynthesis